MNIAVLSRRASLYSTTRLVEAAQQRGHNVRVVDYLRCYMDITSHRPSVVYQGKSLNEIDAVIPRIGASHTFYGTAVVRQFEMAGIYSVNGSQAISRARDKLRSLQLLSRRGIGLPVTGFANSTKDTQGLIDLVGGAPLVVKPLEGTQGIGVVLCETAKAAESVIEAFRGLNANILIQEFIEEAGGSDIRAFVVGQKIVAAMKRTRAQGEFRSNLHRGGTVGPVKLTAAERATALGAAKATGLKVSSVNMLRSDRGPLVLEVNSSPGLEDLEQSTESDVADAIIEYVENHAKPGKATDRVGA